MRQRNRAVRSRKGEKARPKGSRPSGQLSPFLFSSLVNNRPTHLASRLPSARSACLHRHHCWAAAWAMVQLREGGANGRAQGFPEGKKVPP
eukprot:1161510-Pelagomonas_calceolata.AAC.3